MTKPDDDEDLIRFVGRVQPVDLYEIAGELESLGNNGAQWPKATANAWKNTLLTLVGHGKLKLENGMLSVAQQSRDGIEQPTQMTLF